MGLLRKDRMWLAKLGREVYIRTMKWLRRLLFLTSLFLGLYFFGDFRVNDVNVREFLQSKITMDQMKGWGRSAADFFQKLAELIRQKSDTLGDGQKQGGVPGLDKLSGPVSMDDAKKMIGENLSEEDRKKILKLFEKDLATSTATATKKTP